MTHPEEADLIAYAFAEDAPDARTALAAHLAACAGCRHALGELQATLDLTASLDVPARGEAYGRDVWARLEPRLRAVRLPARRSGRPWLAAAAVLLLGTASFLAGRWSRPEAPPAPVSVAAAANPGAIRQRVMLAALGDHFDRAERTLVEVANADPGAPVDVTAEQAWARDLLDANRLYRQSAGSAAFPLVVDLLGELEPVLLEIANGPSRMTAAELDALQARIEARGLVFKLRVARTQVGVRPHFHRVGEPIS